MLGNAPRDPRQPPLMRNTSNASSFPTSHMRSQEIPQNSAIDPALSNPQIDRARDQGYKDAIKAWSRFRFVRAGWFTPAEAIEYID